MKSIRIVLFLTGYLYTLIVLGQQPATVFNDQYLGKNLLDSLKVPEGFSLEIAASELGKPRMIAVVDRNASYFTRTDPGEIVLAMDLNRDGIFDRVKNVMALKGAQGIAVYRNHLYICTNLELRRAKIKSDYSLEPTEVIIDDLPDNGLNGVRTISIGPDGMLYIALGTCPDCKTTENNDDVTVLKIKPEGNNIKVYAHGLRKTTSIAWHPETKEMWAVDQGLDINDNVSLEDMTRIIDNSDDRSLAFANKPGHQSNPDPEDANARTNQQPVFTLPPHSQPINIVFIDRTAAFPPAFLNDALISVHGAWNREEPNGYLVNRIRFSNGMPVGVSEFLYGFLSRDGKTRYGRPTGLAVSPIGCVYVTDDFNGVIYKIAPVKP